MNTTKIGYDYMVRISKFKLSEVIPGASSTVHPAFIVNGKEIDAIYISKYQNAIINGVAYSLPYQKPVGRVSFDKAVRLCENKGAGWHLMSNTEWSAIALWSKAHGTMPHGNTDYGHYHNDDNEKGLLYDNYRTLTGSGPNTWAHDHTTDGIYDLTGNMWEWVSGLRVTNGKLQIIKDNDAATQVDMSLKSKNWVDLGYGFRIENGDITLTTADNVNSNYGKCMFKNLKSSIEVPEQLKALGLFPVDSEIPEGYFWVDNEESEKLPMRGGCWSGTSYAGVFALRLHDSRSLVYTSIGFRSAYFA